MPYLHPARMLGLLGLLMMLLVVGNALPAQAATRLWNPALLGPGKPITAPSLAVANVMYLPFVNASALTPPGPLNKMENIIPVPVATTSTGGRYTLMPTTNIYVEPATADVMDVGQFLADTLKPATGYGFQVGTTQGTPATGNMYLTTVGADPALGDEGYQLTIAPEGLTLVAYRPAGLFRGVQTIRQLLPSAIERDTPEAGPWTMPTGTIRDHPRFVWRGAMLDVARHFFSVADVKRYIDLMAYYKLNRLHLHLSDDQGWRIMINTWPRLATYGGSTQIGGGPGGYYTQAEYADIVAYAQRRHIMVIPEIDMPGHTNAALASYAELNCNGVAPALYTGKQVGFSSLCIRKETTYRFVDDVIRELAAITPGPYIHIGGDEADATSAADYKYFMERVQPIVEKYGKQVIGWEDIGEVDLLPSSIAQHWRLAAPTQAALRQGNKIIMSPAPKAYLDMKYDASTPIGATWAGYTDVQDAYTWDPTTQLAGVAESSILGLEAPMWTERTQTFTNLTYLAFPRLVGHAEIGWSPVHGRNWTEYRVRLAVHGPRLDAMGIEYHRSSQVPWP